MYYPHTHRTLIMEDIVSIFLYFIIFNRLLYMLYSMRLYIDKIFKITEKNPYNLRRALKVIRKNLTIGGRFKSLLYEFFYVTVSP